MSSYCFVLPRVGETNIGGGEFLSSVLAKNLAARGDSVQILSTCARDNRTWENYFNPGEYKEFGNRVRRFPVDQRDLEKWIPLQIRLHQGEKLSVEEQLVWMEHSVNSGSLYQTLAAELHSFDAVFFAPYLFGTTFHGSLLCGNKAVLIPCLHDESYAYTEVIAHMFSKAAGCLFNVPAERRLAERLYGRIHGGVVGMAFDMPERGQSGPFFEEKFPYILYLGRKETGKNVDLLVRLFLKAKDSERLAGVKLVVAGGGSYADLHISRKHPDIIDLSNVSEEQKISLIQNASFLCQPSINESFSIVIMESWMQAVPVLVNSFCEVTKEHAESSAGGLYFADYADFVACTELLTKDSGLRQKMGLNGFEYVKDKYSSWGRIMDNFDLAMKDIFPGFCAAKT